MPVAKALKKKDVEKELYYYVAKGDHFEWAQNPGMDAYEFNIKVRAIAIPEGIRERAPEAELDEYVRTTMNMALLNFVENLEARYSWIVDWAQAGRGGGWLVLVSNDPLFNEYGELEATAKKATRRLRQLDKIEKDVRKAKSTLVRHLESSGAYPAEWSVGWRAWRPS